MATSGLRWGRIALGGFLAELALVIAVIPLQAGGAGQSAITTLALAGSFAALVPVAWWLGRALERPVLHGVLMGAAAAVIYLSLQALTQLLSPQPPEVPPIYYFAHVLKLAGGAVGGWLAARRRQVARHA